MLKKLIFSGVILSLFTACSSDNEQSYFEDEALELAVLEEMDNAGGNLTEEELEKIESLDVSDAEISSLEGIDVLSELQYLNISGNDIEDFSPLQSLDELSEVHLGDIYFTGDIDAPVLTTIEDFEERGVDVHARTRLSFDEHDGPSEGVFYRVQEEDQTVYLLGSVHVGDETMYPLHGQIDEAFEEADHLAVEIDMTEINEMESAQMMMQHAMNADGPALSDVLDEDVFTEMVNQLSPLGLNGEMLDQFQPWFISMLLSEAAIGGTNFTADDGIDLHFLERANEKDLPIISLESIESQIETLSSSPEEEQIASLESAIDSLDIYEEELTQMIRIWRSGDTDVFAQLREMEQDSDDLAMDERDLAMTDQIEEFLTTDDGETYFVVVGALHLAGENSIVDLLDNRGYNVEPHDDFRADE
ncbi:TraB/GumN family protein [Salipaludibacillus sp. HK11]|uniref:TraB/GumN family protein n=1 Tax=Salipaludibacillus sp. HK11 TaxID=3394320 RepID=UPI0039FC4AD6